MKKIFLSVFASALLLASVPAMADKGKCGKKCNKECAKKCEKKSCDKSKCGGNTASCHKKTV